MGLGWSGEWGGGGGGSDERETGEKLDDVGWVGPKVNLVESCWERGAGEEVVDGEAWLTATRGDVVVVFVVVVLILFAWTKEKKIFFFNLDLEFFFFLPRARYPALAWGIGPKARLGARRDIRPEAWLGLAWLGLARLGSAWRVIGFRGVSGTKRVIRPEA